ncbi:hypothetical protein J4214_04285 [Candidatus Woesearchaeota archaeon]|nr:hypothetical protein [Candidatus Woesearchaeota archaeon]
MKDLGIVGVIGRFKPLHHGGATMLEILCERANHVIIGIGSSNKYNLRNPFTPEKTKGMLNAFLSKRFSNYSITYIPDFAHIPEYRNGKKWKECILEHYGELDYFITSNEYVAELLSDSYNIIHPACLIPAERYIMLKSSEVRMEMAKHGNWKSLVPEEVSNYLEENKLVRRFREEFGFETLATLRENANYKNPESMIEEKLHAGEI